MAADRTSTQELTEALIGCCIEVHRHLGPGLLESSYQRCLARELWLRGIEFAEQRSLSLEYKGLELPGAFRVDFLVGGLVIVEVKSVESLSAVHEAQLITYLRLARLPTGLLVNFNVPLLRQGIRRILRPSAPLRSLRSSL
jgi:GxxExxY protein